ncbi:helix-turn-helix transcriptional regulator [Treponema pedis]|uniref:Helix-turn-helix domain-containing protein n=1 Tax=Treponema pedis TaxID=409322 RepID=A0A7S7AW68_9SPIR|nr:AraC family transcriptional regulator [Treponema pedis]QOW60980.1 helix-turn-helix domain-containing protein [Treponema pedis]QSI04253.1 helix-turn-helix domain-containing protein [Treponema pedis]
MGKDKTVSIKIYTGIQIELYDVDTDEVHLLKGKPRNVFRIDYCKHGLLEGEFENTTFSYLGEKETAINYERLALLKAFFPLKIYKGISILFFLDEIDSQFKDIANSFSIDIEKICNKLNLKDGWYKIKSNSEITAIMEKMYDENNFARIDYLKIKILEILHLLGVITSAEYCKKALYSGYHINKVKKIHEYAVNNLDSNISFQNLVKDEDMSYTIFQKLFKQMYGEAPYSYLKKYKLKTAAFYISSTNRKITDIALSCGYTNASKFAEAFKTLYGTPPLQYRNNIKNRMDESQLAGL